MSENSGIEWTDHTFNPWEGCQKVGPGCDHCYAETRNARFAGGTAINWGPGAPRRRTSSKNWHKPVAWDAAHAEFFSQHGRRQRVFCASLADVFDNAVDIGWRANLLDLISKTRHLDWLILTKRIGNAQAMVPAGWFLQNPHVMLGATIVNQDEADRDIPKLLAVPVRRRFLSMEPLLGAVDLRLQRPATESDRQDMDGYCSHITTAAGAGIHWVIVGGESGTGARVMSPEWARDLRDQCKAAGVPFLFKQWGEWAPNWYNDDAGNKIPGSEWIEKQGKKVAGRKLDGVLHDGYPRGVGQ
ncbi:MAG: phage Gp37/Gp68 family protein [Pseudomonadota bacterium]